jgi:hypothetical protein
MFHSFSKVVTVAGIAAAAFAGVSATALAAPAAHASVVTMTKAKPLPPVTSNPASNLSVQPGTGGAPAENVTVVPPVPSATVCPPGVISCENRLSNTTQSEQTAFNGAGAEGGNAIAGLISSVVTGIPSFFLDLVQGFFGLF